jgi:hypothetical protein
VKTPLTFGNATPSASKFFTRINKLRSLEERFIYPTCAAARRQQAKRILFACPGEEAPKSIINSMIILLKNILICFYKDDMENTPFHPDAVWHYTLKRFADLALAQAHEARTLQLRAASHQPPPLPLPIPSKICTLRHLRRGSGTHLLRPTLQIPHRIQPRAIHHQQTENGTAINRSGYSKRIPKMDT